MNKYLVTRHIERNGYETKSEYGIMAVSAEQAISRTRYTNTRTDKHPNGEPTDYYDNNGAHIYWTAELIEADKKAPDLDDVPEVENITKKASEDNKVHIIAKDEAADKFRAIKDELGLAKNVDAFAKILDGYDKPTPNGEAFLLPERLRADVGKYAKLLNCKDEDIYARAVKYYLTRLGKMTLEEFLNVKEGGTNA